MIDSIACVNSIFEQPWWLEAIAPGAWDVIEVKHNEECVCRLSYVHMRQYGIKCIGTPGMSMFSGPWIRETGGKAVTYLGYKKEVLTEMIDMLPKGNISISLAPEQNYYLPFLWKGFKIVPRFTYRIWDTSNLDTVWNNFDKSARKAIKKGNDLLKLRTDMPIEVLFDLEDKTYARQGRKNPTDKDQLRRVYNACLKHDAGVLMCAVDDADRVHTATLYVYDDNTLYAIHGGSDPKLRESQADSYLIWKGLELASQRKLAFDFEGSSIEGIEKYFRSFGGEPLIYYSAQKYNVLMSLIEYIKPIIKKLLGW